jgi:DNA-binding NarL/FixJ family response regulator
VKYNKVNFIQKPVVLNWWVDPMYVDHEAIKRKLLSGKQGIFTTREKDIVKLILQGYTSTEIAAELSLSKHTVITHRKNIFKKCSCHDVKELKLFCLKNRLIEHVKFDYQK